MIMARVLQSNTTAKNSSFIHCSDAVVVNTYTQTHFVCMYAIFGLRNQLEQCKCVALVCVISGNYTKTRSDAKRIDREMCARSQVFYLASGHECSVQCTKQKISNEFRNIRKTMKTKLKLFFYV